MNRFLIQILLLISIFTYVSAQDFFPDASDTINDYDEFDISTAPNITDPTTFTQSNSGTGIEANLTKTTVNQVINTFGVTSTDTNYSLVSPTSIENYKTAYETLEDSNATSGLKTIKMTEGNEFIKDFAKNLKGYSDSTASDTETKGVALFQTLGENFEGINAGDMNTLQTDFVKALDPNSSEARAIQFNQDFYTTTRSYIANLKTISCYATRKLVNSYYCPMSGLENSFFKGGSTKDANDVAKADCEELCDVQSSCLYKGMGKDIQSTINVPETELTGTKEITLAIDETMLGDYIELHIENEYLYDDNITFGSNEYNASKASEALSATNHGVKVDLSYQDVNGTYTQRFTEFDYKLTDTSSVLKIYLAGIRTSSLKIKFYSPYIMDQTTTELSIDSNLKSVLKSALIKYVGNEWWFCPEIHIQASASDCDGTIQQLAIGSVVYPICVIEERQKYEPTYGAFYTKSECESSCHLTSDCVPTYKHLVGLDAYNIATEYSDIEIGCTSEPYNTSCTDTLCKQLFIEDSMPVTEKSWTNDDTVVITVSSSIPSQTETRPRIDVEGGLSANGDAAARALVDIGEMSEISYYNMLEGNSYDISIYNVEDNIPSKMSYSLVSNGLGGNAMYWNLKPASHDYRDGNSYYLYAVFDISTSYLPNSPALADSDGNIALALDRTILLKTATGYKIIKRKLNEATLRTYDSGATQWVETPDVLIDNFETFNGIGFSAFDENSSAEYFEQKEFEGETNYETFFMYSSIEDIAETAGVIFKNQATQGDGTFFTRIYSGDKDPTYGANFNSIAAYGVYSKTELSYNELMDMTINATESEYAFYSSRIQLKEGEIASDGAFDPDKVKMYITGKIEDMNVNVDFVPSSSEEGKKTFIYMLLYDMNSTQGN